MSEAMQRGPKTSNHSLPLAAQDLRPDCDCGPVSSCCRLWLMRRLAALRADPSRMKFSSAWPSGRSAVLAGPPWWLLASRLRWSDRWLVVGTFAAVVGPRCSSPTPVSAAWRRICFTPRLVWSAPGWDGCAIPSGSPGRSAGRSVLASHCARVSAVPVRIDGMDGTLTPVQLAVGPYAGTEIAGGIHP